MMSIRTVPLEVERALESHGAPAGTTILVAYSAGPDSTALLAALCSIATPLQLTIVAAYFDHGIRSARQIRADIKVAARVTAFLGASFSHGRSTPALPGEGGPEAVARAARYQFLEREADRVGARWIAVGHTADDRAETILMRSLTGGGIAGLAGLRARRGRIIRPMLGLRRSDTLAYVTGLRLKFRRDPENTNLRYRRNRVRRLLVLAERSFPDASCRLAKLAEHAEAAHRFIEAAAATRIPWAPIPGGVSVAWRRFCVAPAVLRREALYRAFDIVVSDESSRKLPYRHIARLLDDRSASLSEALPLHGHGVSIAVEGSSLSVRIEVVRGYRKGYLWEAAGSGSYKIPGTAIEIRRLAFEGSQRPKAAAGLVALGPVDDPLLIRSRRPGDAIRLRSGTKPLKKLLQEWRASERDRWIIPVVADRRGVLAVCGAAFGFEDVISTVCSDARARVAGTALAVVDAEEDL